MKSLLIYLSHLFVAWRISRTPPTGIESRSDAQSLLLALTHFPFIVALVIAKDVLAYTKALRVKLQGRYVDIVRAYNNITFVKTTLQCARDDVDTVHARMYETALEIAMKVGVDESMPRTTMRQRHRTNVPSSNPSEYYKRVLTIPTLDHLITEMDLCHTKISP